MTFLPTPVQQPRIPVWVVGAWPRERSMRRAVRWDGIIAQAQDAAGRGIEADPGIIRPIAEYAARERPPELSGRSPEIIASGTTPAGDPEAAAAIVRAFAEAGATWWVEADWQDGTVGGLRRRIAAGPPREAGIHRCGPPPTGSAQPGPGTQIIGT
jgi:hypothetical protein